MRRTAGLAWASIAHYFVVEELVRRAWTLPYDRRTNVISDLGALGCGDYQGRAVCSPEHAWINASFGLVGVGVAAGAVLLRRAAPELVTRPVLALYAAAGAGSVLVGAFPEDTGGPWHALGAGLFFVGANLGHVELGRRLRAHGNRSYGVALSVLGGVGLVATALFVGGVDLGIGDGFVERVVVYGADLGFITTGVALAAGRLRATRPAR